MTPPNNSGLSEPETRAKLIDLAIHKRGWTENMIRHEETAGSIEVIGGKARRRFRGQVDYTLRLKIAPDDQPVVIALIEARKESLPPTHGLEQAKAYAQQQAVACGLCVLLQRSSVRRIQPLHRRDHYHRGPMAGFPPPEVLRRRYEQHLGFDLQDAAARPLLKPYHNGEGGRRYYQDAAIRAVLEKIARTARRGESPRALLALATGTGKTFIAINLLKRIANAGQLRRALFLCDRKELRSQALAAFQNVFGSDAAAVERNSDGSNHARNARVHIATYQTLGVDSMEGDASFLIEHYPEDYFSHIVIDECHRSAWGKWSQVLTRNPGAVQVGLTATPRTLKSGKQTKEARQDARISVDNRKYFGEPVYEYDMAQAMEDGYLAGSEIQKGRVNLDETGIGIDKIMARNPRNPITGLPVTREGVQEHYEKTRYEDRILLLDRVLKMSQNLFEYLPQSGAPEQKTIVFCVRDRHADDIAITLGSKPINF